MHCQHKSASTRAQRSPAVYDDARVAEAQFTFLQAMGEPELLWVDGLVRRSGRLRGDALWDFIEHFDRGCHGLWYRLDDDWLPLPVDDMDAWGWRAEWYIAHRGDWRAILRARGCWLLVNCVMLPVATGKRSSVAYKIAMTLRDHGATGGEIACVLAASLCWCSKWGEDNWPALAAEVERIMRR